jgi:hypothetical protein
MGPLCPRVEVPILGARTLNAAVTPAQRSVSARPSGTCLIRAKACAPSAQGGFAGKARVVVAFRGRFPKAKWGGKNCAGTPKTSCPFLVVLDHHPGPKGKKQWSFSSTPFTGPDGQRHSTAISETFGPLVSSAGSPRH